MNPQTRSWNTGVIMLIVVCGGVWASIAVADCVEKCRDKLGEYLTGGTTCKAWKPSHCGATGEKTWTPTGDTGSCQPATGKTQRYRCDNGCTNLCPGLTGIIEFTPKPNYDNGMACTPLVMEDRYTCQGK